MSASVNIYEAKTQLSKLVARAESGEEIILTRHGRPVARLAPIEEGTIRRAPGAWHGRVSIHDDFDVFTEEDASAWYGR